MGTCGDSILFLSMGLPCSDSSFSGLAVVLLGLLPRDSLSGLLVKETVALAVALGQQLLPLQNGIVSRLTPIGSNGSHCVSGTPGDMARNRKS